MVSIFSHLPKYAGTPSLSFSIFQNMPRPHLYLFQSSSLLQCPIFIFFHLLIGIWTCSIFIFQRYLFSNPGSGGGRGERRQAKGGAPTLPLFETTSTTIVIVNWGGRTSGADENVKKKSRRCAPNSYRYVRSGVTSLGRGSHGSTDAGERTPTLESGQRYDFERHKIEN